MIRNTILLALGSFVVCLLCFLGYLLKTHGSTLILIRELKASGVSTQATISDKIEHANKKGKLSYSYPYYFLTQDGVRVTGELSATKGIAKPGIKSFPVSAFGDRLKVAPGATFSATYLRDAPEKHLPYSVNSSHFSKQLLLLSWTSFVTLLAIAASIGLMRRV